MKTQQTYYRVDAAQLNLKIIICGGMDQRGSKIIISNGINYPIIIKKI
jgi:hypothetical protein